MCDVKFVAIHQNFESTISYTKHQQLCTYMCMYIQVYIVTIDYFNYKLINLNPVSIFLNLLLEIYKAT